MNQNLRENIISTICYYDILDYPLTLFEVWKNLLTTNSHFEQDNISLGDVASELKNPEISRFVENKDGMYFLRGREGLVEQRIRKNKISVLKLKRMQKLVGLLRWSPFVRMILVTGRLAMKNARPRSDWDVLVVLKSGRIWIGRTFVTLLAHFLGKRRHHDKIRNRICFNYFITTDSLEIKNKDIYSANEYSFCFPIFDSKNYFDKFQVRNHWIRKYKINYYLSRGKNIYCLKDSKFSRIIRSILENFLDHDFLEKYLRKIETKKIIENPKTKSSNSLINISDEALIFLPNPQGPEIFEKFKDKLHSIKY